MSWICLTLSVTLGDRSRITFETIYSYVFFDLLFLSYTRVALPVSRGSNQRLQSDCRSKRIKHKPSDIYMIYDHSLFVNRTISNRCPVCAKRKLPENTVIENTTRDRTLLGGKPITDNRSAILLEVVFRGKVYLEI